MRCAAGVLAEGPQVVGVKDATLVQFGLSPDRLGDTMLLESTFASPGRYVGEMVLRLRRFYPEARTVLAVNPYFDVSPSLVEVLVRRATADDGGGTGFTVYTDDSGVPLAYAFSAETTRSLPAVHLALLSSTDGALDERFLGASVGPGRRVSVGALGRGLYAVPGNCNFWRLSPALAEATRRAAAVLEALPDDAARRDYIRAGDRAAVIGYHAGDVLFWIQAIRLEQAPFRSLVVLSPYADIVAYLAPDLECLQVQHPIPHRPGYPVTDDMALLWSYVVELEKAGAPPRLWHLFRPFREYSRPRHHLREAMASALGGVGRPRRPPLPFVAGREERERVRPRPARVVVCFEGGWPLKEFPREQRGELLSLLVEDGYDPVIVGKPVPEVDVPAVPYAGLSSYRVLLGSAEAMIGGDSFPAHFSQVLGVPTIQMFGSTRPSNSSGTADLRYRALHHPLPCVPCGEQVRCRLDGGHSCHAQPTSSEVLAALRELAPPRRRDQPTLYGPTRRSEVQAVPRDVDRYSYDYHAALARVSELAAFVPPGAAVLDIGCGLGAMVRRLDEQGYRAVGIEPDEELARQASIYSGVPVVSDLGAVAARVGMLDAALMFDVFEHLHDPVTYLHRLRPLMCRDGLVVVDTFRTDCEDLLRRAGLDPFWSGDDPARIRLVARWAESNEAKQ
jgi:Methyltransferase domain